MKKVFAPTILSVGMLLGTGCVISTDGGFHSSEGFFGQNSAREEASRNEVHPLTLSEGSTFEVDLPAGNVTVEAGAPGSVELKARVAAYGKSDEEARKSLDGTHLLLEQTATGMRLRLAGPTIEAQATGNRNAPSPRADLELRLPRDVALTFDLGSGEIRTRGPIGSSKLRSQYGAVAVESATGDLRMESSSGKVTLGGLKGAKSFVARSSYGNLSAASVEAEQVEMHTGSGSVELTDATSSRVDLRSDYGKIVLRRVGGDVVAKTSSGSVAAEELSGKSASLKSSYGTISVRGLRGTLKAETSSGNVVVEDFDGDCELESNYGHVRAAGRFDRFAGITSSGSVNVEALPGSTMTSDWSLKSGYGAVSLSIPRELGFQLEAKTDYGNLDIQFPVTVEAGALKKKSAVRGQVGAGGKRLALETSSGNIRVVPIEVR